MRRTTVDGSFPIALSVTIRLCRREDLDDLEWFGQWREHRPLLEQAFAAQGRGEQVIDEWIMRKNLSNRKENQPCSGSN